MNESTAPTCFPDGIPDEDYFREVRTLKRSYTAKQVKAIEARKELVLMCAAAGYPIRMIAEKAHLDIRLVSALIAKHSEKIASNCKDFAQALRTCGARWLSLAMAKEDEATFKDLVNGSSLAVQRANDLTLIAGMGESTSEKNVYEIDSSNQPSARDRVLALLKECESKPAPQIPA